MGVESGDPLHFALSTSRNISHGSSEQPRSSGFALVHWMLDIVLHSLSSSIAAEYLDLRPTFREGSRILTPVVHCALAQTTVE